MDEVGKQPPSVLVVIVDDMGVHQVGYHGSGFYETPRIDRLASTGVKFNCAYSAAPVCSPARAALYTGIHPARLHLTNYIPGTEPENPRLLTPPWRAYLPVEVETLGDVFKAGGYATGHFGKWHLAPTDEMTPVGPYDHWPLQRGFDRFYGFLDGATDQWTPDLVEDNHPIDPPRHAGADRNLLLSRHEVARSGQNGERGRPARRDRLGGNHLHMRDAPGHDAIEGVAGERHPEHERRRDPAPRLDGSRRLPLAVELQRGEVLPDPLRALHVRALQV